MTKVVHLDYPVVDLSNQVILPFPEGCHVATFTASGLSLGHGNDFEPADVYCFSTIDDEIVQINTSVIGRFVDFFFISFFISLFISLFF